MTKIDFTTMRYEVSGKLARVTINRPHALNSMPYETVAEMEAIATLLDRERGVRAVAITGAGRAFSAGIDLKALSRGDIDRTYLEPWERFLRRLETMDKIVLCLMHGFCIGGGLQLALACDIRVATPTVKLGLPAVKEGLIPGMSPWRLAQIVGLGRAKSLTLSGRLIDGAAAHAIGLVDYLVPEASAHADFETLLADYLANASEAARGAKRYLNASFGMGFDDAYAEYMRLQLAVFDGPDFAEAKSAFASKRKPEWR